MDRVIKENIQKQENLRRGEISNKAFESSKMAGKDTCWQALSPITKTHKVETEIWLPQVVLWPLQALLCMDITPHKHAHRKINKHKKIKLWIEYSPTTYPFWHLFSQPSFCISVLLITQKRSRKCDVILLRVAWHVWGLWTQWVLQSACSSRLTDVNFLD